MSEPDEAYIDRIATERAEALTKALARIEFPAGIVTVEGAAHYDDIIAIGFRLMVSERPKITRMDRIRLAWMVLRG